jgi:hypothetical protein
LRWEKKTENDFAVQIKLAQTNVTVLKIRHESDELGPYWYFQVSNKMEESSTAITVGQPFPGPIPQREGAIMELWKIGLTIVIQFPGLRQGELNAFYKGFKTYAYLESPTSIPIPTWIFDFPNPHGKIDSAFNAGFVEPALLSDYMDTSKGVIKNGLNFFLLDGDIVKGIRLVALNHEAVGLFHNTIRKQLKMDYDEMEYLSCLGHFSQEQQMSFLKWAESFSMEVKLIQIVTFIN